MTLPGLALFYGGLVRKKNVLSVLAQCLGITGLVTILWWAFGYSFVFGKSHLKDRRVTRNNEWVKLSAKEYALLRLLATHHDKVLTHRQILAEVWGPEALARTHYLRVFMMRLRRKIEDEPDAPKHLQTESSIGYRLVTEPAA